MWGPQVLSREKYANVEIREDHERKATSSEPGGLGGDGKERKGEKRRGEERKRKLRGHHLRFNLSSPGQSSIGKRWDRYDKGKAQIGGTFKTCTIFGTLRVKTTMWCGLKTLSAKFSGPILAALLAEHLVSSSTGVNGLSCNIYAWQWQGCYQHQVWSAAGYWPLFLAKWPLSLVFWHSERLYAYS